MLNAGPWQVSIQQARAFFTASKMSKDPRKEYQARLSEWSRREEILEQSHLRMGNFRACFFFGVLLMAAVLCRSEISWELVGMGLLVGLLLTGIWHLRIESGRNTARRGMSFYELGLERLDGTWPGKGSPGTEFLDPHHPYAADLDLFGAGSLFELVNAAHTQNGRATLAAWLLESASAPEIVARQEAIKELSPKMDLRERLGFAAAEAQAWIPTESLTSWARQPRLLHSPAVRVTAFCSALDQSDFIRGRAMAMVPAIAGRAEHPGRDLFAPGAASNAHGRHRPA